MKTEKEYNQKKHNNGLNRRAFLLLFKKAPLFFISVLGEKVFTSLLPFIGIFFSARIINELVLIYSGKGDLSKIKTLVLLSPYLKDGQTMKAGALIINCKISMFKSF